MAEGGKEEETEVRLGVGPPLPVKTLPKAPATFKEYLVRCVGPGVILGSLAVGGFETQGVPYMASRGVLGVFWLAVLSAIVQSFWATELGRWAVVTGEDFFLGVNRIKPGRFWPWFWVVASTNLYWPIYMTAAGYIFMRLTGTFDTNIWSWILFAILILFFVFAPKVYSVLEKFFYVTYTVTIIAAIALLSYAVTPSIAAAVLSGFFLPITNPFEYFWKGVIPLSLIATCLVQYGGGTWNLLQSGWFVEKGYGMSSLVPGVTGLVWKAKEVPTRGVTFNTKDPEQLKEYRKWMKWLDVENFGIYFVLATLITIAFATISYAIFYPTGGIVSKAEAPISIALAAKEVHIAFFYLMAICISLQMWDTSWGLLDGISRMTADAVWRTAPNVARKKTYSWWYFLFFFIYVIIGIALVPVERPFMYWVIQHYAMIFQQIFLSFLIIYMNGFLLPKEVRAPKWRLIIIGAWGIFLLIFFIYWVGLSVAAGKVV